MRGPCRSKTNLDERPVAFTAAKDDFVETLSALKCWLEICADDVGEEPEDLKNVRLAGAVRAHKHVEIAQRQRDLPQASKVLHRQAEQSTVHVRDLSRKGSRKPRSSHHVLAHSGLHHAGLVGVWGRRPQPDLVRLVWSLHELIC
jgi:hypothetical protein